MISSCGFDPPLRDARARILRVGAPLGPHASLLGSADRARRVVLATTVPEKPGHLEYDKIRAKLEHYSTLLTEPYMDAVVTNGMALAGAEERGTEILAIIRAARAGKPQLPVAREELSALDLNPDTLPGIIDALTEIPARFIEDKNSKLDSERKHALETRVFLETASTR